MMRIKDIDITQESVEKFLDEINIEALADKEFAYTLKNTNAIFGDMGAAA